MEKVNGNKQDTKKLLSEVYFLCQNFTEELRFLSGKIVGPVGSGAKELCEVDGPLWKMYQELEQGLKKEEEQ